MSSNEERTRIVLLEAFYGGSHRQLLDYLEMILIEQQQQQRRNHGNDDLVTVQKICMSDKKWHWRMRTSALHFSQEINKDPTPVSTLFVSSVINLAELIGLCTRVLRNSRKILYFHENQLVYPVRKQQERDFQYGYNQILSCLAADIVLFNSAFNMKSFLDNIQSYLKLMPDYRPKNLKEQISGKCQVLYYLFKMPPAISSLQGASTSSDEDVQGVVTGGKDSPLHIVWAHRWEHDKNPEEFFDVLFQLQDETVPFKVSVLGQMYTDAPEVFDKAKERLHDSIEHWGYQESRESYFSILLNADVAISTATHEFFGVSMLEAVSCGCYPLCPNRLVYPEFFPDCHLYNTKQQLKKKLKQFCMNPNIVRNHQLQIDLKKFDPVALEPKYLALFNKNDVCQS